MRIYIPNTSKQGIGGGWTFIRNIKNGLMRTGQVQFVDDWKDCDVLFIIGITIVDKNEVYEASKAGKKIVLRVDNVPKKSRNKRSTPHERLKEFAELADVVIYQSEWAKNYCRPLCGEGAVIYNGVDTKIFYKADEEPKADRYLFAYHGKSELKGFWIAHYIFQMASRDNADAEFWFIYDFGRSLPELEESNYDFWNGEKYRHLPMVETSEAMADIMRQCKYLIYPSVADASPNIVLEARACGLEVINNVPYDFSGTAELLNSNLDISLGRMAEEYLGVFKLLQNE